VRRVEGWYQWEWEGGGQRVLEGEYGINSVLHMYVNGKMIPAEAIPGMGGGGIKNGGGGKFKYNIFDTL
jgi:hypothetical protein